MVFSVKIKQNKPLTWIKPSSNEMNGNENNPYFSSGAFTTGAEITYSSFLKPNKCAF